MAITSNFFFNMSKIYLKTYIDDVKEYKGSSDSLLKSNNSSIWWMI